ncbi:MAG: hypothetical protein ACK5AC_02310 [Planctomycetota bacterium]|jgi:hypothetical protein
MILFRNRVTDSPVCSQIRRPEFARREWKLDAEAAKKTRHASAGTWMPLQDWPVAWATALPDWLGDMEIALPAENCFSKPGLLGILASHRRREEPLTAWWEHAMESALLLAKRSQRVLFFSATSPYADRLRHACERFGLAYLELRRSDTDDRVASPKTVLLRCVGNPLPNQPNLADSPIEDRAIAILSHQLFGIHVRQGGKVAALIEARLGEPSMTPGTTLVAIRDSSASARNSSRRVVAAPVQLSKQGAVLWMPKESTTRWQTTEPDAGWGCRLTPPRSTRMPFGHATANLLHSKHFLIHFTRRRHRAWPDQSESNLFDEAIRLEWDSARKPIQTLRRILTTQRLIASHFLRRGSARTVCFTAQSLHAMLEMRGFQSHLGRWDWEPYGIAIRRAWLVAHGARPVQYLHPDQIASLSPDEQTFAQPLPKDDRHRDWSAEQEWRILEDVRLCHVPADQAFLFVHHRHEAAALSSWSRWPIVFISSDP